MPISVQELLAAQRWRYATKSFDPARSIPADQWQALEDCLVLSPSSYGLQPWKFLVIDDPALRQQLRPHSWDQSQITDCSHLVVLLAQRTISAADADRFVASVAAARGQELSSLDTYRQMIQVDLIDGPRAAEIERWASNQLYIALGNLMTSAALLGIDTCPIEGFSPAEYDRILELESSPYRTRVVCACGYRSADDKYANLPKVRYTASALIEHR
jgi:nitroreductase